MTAADLVSLGQLASSLGVVGLLAVAIVAMWRGWVVTRGHHEDVLAELRKQAEAAQRQAEQERAERMQATALLAAYTKSIDGWTDALADLRETVRELGRARTA